MNIPRTTARFETKPGDGKSAGYERWRSWEWRPHTPRQSKEGVYVYLHRLLAVAMAPPDMPTHDVLESLEGKDVHHVNGIKWDNRPDNLELLSHGRHSSVTQAQQRAWAKDAQETAQEETQAQAATSGCRRCGDEDATLVGSPAFDGELCVTCATEVQQAQKQQA